VETEWHKRRHGSNGCRQWREIEDGSRCRWQPPSRRAPVEPSQAAVGLGVVPLPVVARIGRHEQRLQDAVRLCVCHRCIARLQFGPPVRRHWRRWDLNVSLSLSHRLLPGARRDGHPAAGYLGHEGGAHATGDRALVLDDHAVGVDQRMWQRLLSE
jgi:hypothetical protein